MTTLKKIAPVLLVFAIVLFSGLINDSSAQSVSQKTTISPFEAFVPCANDGLGETVRGTVVLHTVTHTNKRGFVTKSHSQPMHTDLVGLITGMKYQGNGVTQTMKPWLNGGGAIVQSYVNRYHIVGKGIQFYIKTHEHLTINANGEVTVNIVESSVECK